MSSINNTGASPKEIYLIDQPLDNPQEKDVVDGKRMSQGEIERLQKKGRLVWRPIEDENGNFNTTDKTSYHRDKNGTIRRFDKRVRQSKKERLKARRANDGKGRI